jgi:hypothetical protein
MANGTGKMMRHCPECHGTTFKMFSVFSLKDDGSMPFYGTECVTCGTLMDTVLKPFVDTLDSEVLRTERLKSYH